MKKVIISTVVIVLISTAIALILMNKKASEERLDELRVMNAVKLTLQHNNLAEFNEDDSSGFWGIMAPETVYSYDYETKQQIIRTPIQEVAKEATKSLHDVGISYTFGHEYEDKVGDTSLLVYRIVYYGPVYMPSTTYNYSASND